MIYDEDPLRRRPRESTARRLRHERCVWMARETTKWPSTRWPITKIMSSDGCNGNGAEFPWRWGRGTISANLDVIWGMSVELATHRRLHLKLKPGLFSANGFPPSSDEFSKEKAEHYVPSFRFRWLAKSGLLTFRSIQARVRFHVGLCPNVTRGRHCENG